MALSLAFLPPFILDAILRSDSSSISTLQLWLTGNRTLQSKLAAGVTKIDLRDQREYSASQFPILLGSLRALRELTIDKSHTMIYSQKLAQNVRRLPTTLRKLTLRVQNSHNVLFPFTASNSEESAIDHSNTDHTPLSTGNGTFATAFPCLETLELSIQEVWTKGHFDLLPPSITCLLGVKLPKDADMRFSSALPRQLLTFEVYGRSTILPSFWPQLPPNLTRIKVNFDTTIPNDADSSIYLDTARSLPRSLTEFKGDSYSSFVDIAGLPSSLKTLKTRWLHGFDPKKPFPIAQQLPNLQHFSADLLTPQLLQVLPSNVQIIHSRWFDDQIESKHWPSSLTKLNVRDQSPNFSISRLPSNGLTFINMEPFIIDLDDVKYLPRTLLEVIFRVGASVENEEEFALPPNLTKLSAISRDDSSKWLQLEPLNVALDDEEDTYDSAKRALLVGRKVLSCFPYAKLPRSLTYLYLDSLVPASQLKHLPRRLQNLNVDDIFEDADYIPNDASEMEAMAEIFEVGRQEGIEESFNWKSLSTTSIPTLLPRTLRYLSIWADAAGQSHSFDWKLIPPQTEHIWCKPAKGIPGRFLPHLPLKHLKYVNIAVTDAMNNHIIPLKDVRSVHLTFRDSPDLTSQVLLTHLPASSFYMYSVPHLRGQLAELHRLMKAHASDEDPSFFLRLLRPDQGIIELLEAAVAALPAKTTSTK